MRSQRRQSKFLCDTVSWISFYNILLQKLFYHRKTAHKKGRDHEDTYNELRFERKLKIFSSINLWALVERCYPGLRIPLSTVSGSGKSIAIGMLQSRFPKKIIQFFYIFSYLV